MELLIVVLIIGILLLIAMGFHQMARERAGDAVAKSNLRVAVPAAESYHADQGTYAGMTLAVLQASYSPGITGIEVLAADASSYCLRSTVDSRTWYKPGPGGTVTQTACA